jgi:hypothetical protein
MDKKLQSILARLGPHELSEARTYLTMRLEHAQKMQRVQNKSDDLSELCLQAIVAVMQERGADFTNVPQLMRNRSAYASFQKNFEGDRCLGEWLNRMIKHNRVKMIALVRIGCHLLADDMMNWRNSVVNSTSLMYNFNCIPAALNQAFPGYAQAGLLHLVIRSSNDAQTQENDNEGREQSNGSVPTGQRRAAGERVLLHDTGRGTGRGSTRRVRPVG